MATENEPTAEGEKTPDGTQKQQEQTFTQADVDRIVKDRITRVEAKYADYDDLKTKAEGAKTVEQKVADLETKLSASEARALRAQIAAEFGISTKKGPKGEPSDADLFLTGTDEATLTAQAERLGVREADRKKHGNVAPKEGETKTSGDTDATLREFAKDLFGNTD
jgi:multidrug efflux pump subunit AcrA (membrane-fusion protein)